MRLLGLAALVLSLVNTYVKFQNGLAYELFWACHIAVLLVGFGLLLRNGTLNAIGLLWSCVGTPLWILDLVTGSELLPMAVLTHLGTPALGLIGVRELGLPRHAAIKALAAFVPLWVVCRLVTPPALNVNLAFRVHSGWESYFASYPMYFGMLLAISAVIFAIVQRLLTHFLTEARA